MINRIILFTSLALLAFFSMLNGETVELRIVNYYLSNWVAAQIIYRLFILTVTYTALLILFGSNSKITKISAFFCVGLMLTDTILNFSGVTSFNYLFIHTPFKVISFITLGVACTSVLFYLKSNTTGITKKWLILVLIAPAIAFSLIRIVYIEDWTTRAQNEKQISLKEANNLLRLHEQENFSDSLLIPFLSTSCSHCKNVATKLSISMRNGKLPNTVIVFPSDKEKAKRFIEETNLLGINYITIDKMKLVELAGMRSPSVFFITKEKSEQWIGASFNNFCMSSVER